MLTWQSIFSGQQECCSSLKRKCFLYIFFINYRLFNLFNTMRNQTSVSRHNWQRIYGVKLDEEFLSRFDVLTNLYTKNRQTMQRFRDVDEQIEKFYSENKQDDNIREWKKKLASKLSKDFEKMVHGKNCLAICGSTINGCATKYSDLDLCLCAPDGQDQYNFNRKEELSKFYDFLKNQKQAGKLTNLQFYHDAKVPVIKFRWNEPIWYYGNPYLHLDVDLIVGNPCTAWLIDLYSDYDWRFPVLCLFLKEWAKQSGVISAFQGRTLNSVSITLMLIHFLQVGTSPPVLPNIQYLMNDAGTVEDWKQKRIDCWDKILKPLRAKVPRNGNSLSQLLFAFFAYYADFDFVERMISVSNGSSLRRESDHRQSGHMIIIEEPFTEENAARAVNYEGYQLVRSKIWDAKLALFENHPLPLLPIIEQSNFWSNVGTVAAIGITAAALLLRR